MLGKVSFIIVVIIVAIIGILTVNKFLIAAFQDPSLPPTAINTDKGLLYDAFVGPCGDTCEVADNADGSILERLENIKNNL